MRHPFIVGKKLYLRGLEEPDLGGDYFQWLNDLEVTKFMDSGVFPNTMEKMEEYYRNTVLSNNNVIFAIVDKKSDKHIGNIRLGPIDWLTRISPLGIMIGDKKFWGKGYGTKAIRLVLDYAFKRLNMHKVTLGVAVINHAAVKTYEKAGFITEGQAKSQVYLDGKYYDALYMGVTAEDFLGDSDD